MIALADTVELPTASGFSIRLEQLPKLADLVARALAEARARGRFTGALPAITVFDQPKWRNEYHACR
ncbi:MAG: hypothetical protein WB822_10755 [Rhodoplanes sp.]